MSETPGTLELVARHLALALRPLVEGLSDLPHFQELMFRLGWTVADLPPQFTALSTAVNTAVTKIEALRDDPSADEIAELLQAIRQAHEAIRGIAVAPSGVDASAFLAEIGERLPELLLTDYLAGELPRLYNLLLMLNVIRLEHQDEASQRQSFLRAHLDWSAIPKILSHPQDVPKVVYGWGTPDLNVQRLIDHLSELFFAIGLPVTVEAPDGALSAKYAGLDEPGMNAARSLVVPFWFGRLAGQQLQAAVALRGLPAIGSALPGLVIEPQVPSEFPIAFPLSETTTLRLVAGTNAGSLFGILIRPDDTSIKYPFAPDTQPPQAGVGVGADFNPPTPATPLGSAGATRLELKGAALDLAARAFNGECDVVVSAQPKELNLVLAAKELDGFLGSLLGGGETRIPVPLRLSWSSRTGLDFVAGLGFEVSVYPHLDLELVRFDRVDLGVRSLTAEGGPAKLELRVACALSGAFGPIAYSADGVGVHLPVTLAPGNAGPFDIGFGVLLPDAIGLVVDSGPVSGGGFMQRDPDKGRYCGMLELSMFDIAVAATGVLETKDTQGEELPPPGYSLFIAVSAEFSPIQLGYGFTLNGVGGLAAVHRRVNVDAVSSRLREGVLDGVMFPKDPVVNAPAIISNLTTVFPTAMNRYVFGPMAIIGWGTPNLVRAEIAVLLEVPEPVLLVILGQASVVIPPEAEEPVIEINVDFVGVLDYASSSFALDATLRDSTVAGVAITGDMAMRLVWAGKRNLVIAIGGVHPHFTPPPGFPSLRRISMALGSDNPRITIEAYYALTANSRQFGAKAELYAAAAGFSVRGWLFFDSLFTIMPLWFRIDFDAGMTLNRGSRRIAGITVRGALTGPAPFHAWGEGRLSLLFFDVCVPFDVTFGPHRVFELLGRDPWPLLKTAIESVESWVAELGRGVAAAASMRPAPPGGAALLLHPMGAATLRQHVLPLNRPLERFGEFAIEGPDRFDVTTIRVGEDEIANSDWSIAEDDFAPGDFEALSETDRLSRDSFERMAAGVAVGGDLVDAPQNLMKVAKVAYETRIIDEGAPGRVRVLPTFDLSRAVQLSTGGRGAKACSLFVRSGRAKFAREAARPLGVTLGPETYAVATTDTLVLRADISTPTTSGAAHLAVKSKVGRGAAARGLQVVPTHELESAA
jgi:hypothetical protein